MKVEMHDDQSGKVTLRYVTLRYVCKYAAIIILLLSFFIDDKDLLERIMKKCRKGKSRDFWRSASVFRH